MLSNVAGVPYPATEQRWLHPLVCASVDALATRKEYLHVSLDGEEPVALRCSQVTKPSAARYHLTVLKAYRGSCATQTIGVQCPMRCYLLDQGEYLVLPPRPPNGQDGKAAFLSMICFVTP